MRAKRSVSLDAQRADALREVGVVQAPHLSAVKQQIVDGQVHIGESVVLAAARTAEAVCARAVVRNQLKKPPLQHSLADRMLPPYVRLAQQAIRVRALHMLSKSREMMEETA